MISWDDGEVSELKRYLAKSGREVVGNVQAQLEEAPQKNV